MYSYKKHWKFYETMPRSRTRLKCFKLFLIVNIYALRGRYVPKLILIRSVALDKPWWMSHLSGTVFRFINVVRSIKHVTVYKLMSYPILTIVLFKKYNLYTISSCALLYNNINWPTATHYYPCDTKDAVKLYDIF